MEFFGGSMTMSEFMVRCVWPDGDVEFHLCASEREARAWASDARRDGDCTAGVYGLLALKSPQAEDWQPDEELKCRAVRAVSVNGTCGRSALWPGVTREHCRSRTMPPPDRLPPAQTVRM